MPAPVEIVGHTPEPLHAVAYVSTPAVPFTDRELNDLLLVARARNAADGVTGKLVVLEDGGRVTRFAQWIEGPRSALEAVVGRILADERHTAIDVRRRGPVPRRRFAGWDMAFESAPPTPFEARAEALCT